MGGNLMEPLKISVITPSFNSGKYIERAIKSVLDQDYENFEHVVMDGQSTDDTIEILKKYPHLIWVSEQDSGQSEAMNKGFAAATGDVIVYLNADDYFLPGAFKAVVPSFEEGAMVVVGNLQIITLNGKAITVSCHVEHEAMLHHWREREPVNDGLSKTPFPNNPVQYFYRREVQAGIPFNEQNHFTMDVEFLMAASSRYDFVKIEAVLGAYVLLEDAKSIVASRDVETYWTAENFSFIDQYLMTWPTEKVIRFKNEQQKGYLTNALSHYKSYCNRRLKHLIKLRESYEAQISEQQALIERLQKRIGVDAVIHGCSEKYLSEKR